MLLFGIVLFSFFLKCLENYVVCGFCFFVLVVWLLNFWEVNVFDYCEVYGGKFFYEKIIFDVCLLYLCCYCILLVMCYWFGGIFVFVNVCVFILFLFMERIICVGFRLGKWFLVFWVEKKIWYMY